MPPFLRSSALFFTILLLASPLGASDGSELPLPVRIKELEALESAGTSAIAAGLEEGKEAGLLRQQEVEALKVPGLPPQAALRTLSFPDGMHLLVFRNHQGIPDADLRGIVRLQDGSWSAPQAIGREAWRGENIGKPPFSLSQCSPRATLAWYTEADNEPRLLVSQTPDAGQRWTAAMRADLGRPEGRHSQVTLSDGSILLCWLERPGDDASQPGGLYLRRYAPNGASVMPALLAIVSPERLSVGPGLSVLEDRGDGSGVLQLVYEEGGKRRALRLALPDRAVLEDLDHSCRCGPPQDPGHALRARIISLDTKAGTVLLSHGAVPGLLRPGELRASLAAEAFAALQPGDELLGRIQPHRGGWRLLFPRRLGSRP